MDTRLTTPGIGAVAVALLCAACTSSGGGGTGGGGTSDADGGSSSGGGTSYNQYNTLHGTFVAPGINVALSGAMVGRSMTNAGTPDTAWNAAGSFDLEATDNQPTPLTVSGTFPSGETAVVSVGLGDLLAAPAAGTYDCTGSGGSEYEAGALFQLFPDGGTTAVYQYIASDDFGGVGSTCTFALDAPTAVTETGEYGPLTLYFAHGSFTATMVGSSNADDDGGTTTGTMSLTW